MVKGSYSVAARHQKKIGEVEVEEHVKPITNYTVIHHFCLHDIFKQKEFAADC